MPENNLLKQASQSLRDNWREISKTDINKAKGNVESLVATIAEKTGESASSVRDRVTRLVEDAQERRKKKSVLSRVRGFFTGLLKLVAALVAVAVAAAVGLMFWRKRMEGEESQSGFAPAGSEIPPAEPVTMDQAATLHSVESAQAPPTTTTPPDETS